MRQAAEAGDLALAATRAIEGHGPEIYRFLVGFLRDEGRADEVFALWCSQVWEKLDGFKWLSSFRTWAFSVARHAALHHRRGDQNQARRAKPLDEAGPASALAEVIRSRTRPYLRTEIKDRFAELRAKLPEEDRLLLGLRLDRELPWRDVAEIMAPEEGGDKKVAARLRKRFEALKERLAERMREALDPEP
ncbi:MAG TPA: sigma-70 family RNA polymerase sigma factor [Myxococcota bacterium]|nr:sigma-70 family RNA polymerase sigma factor [Myxococcota bacterium]